VPNINWESSSRTKVDRANVRCGYLRDGKISEMWEIVDVASLREQLSDEWSQAPAHKSIERTASAIDCWKAWAAAHA